MSEYISRASREDERSVVHGELECHSDEQPAFQHSSVLATSSEQLPSYEQGCATPGGSDSTAYPAA